MNVMNAYQTCHELMLAAPQYTAVEGAEVSYILIQIGETETAIRIQGQIIDPRVPVSGTSGQFLGLPLHKQMAITSLKDINKAIHAAQETCESLYALRRQRNEMTDDEFIEYIRNKLENMGLEPR